MFKNQVKPQSLLLALIAGISLSCSTLKMDELQEEAFFLYPPEQPFPESSFMEVDGERLHIRQWKADVAGDPKGLVLLIHGVSGSSYNWRVLAPALAWEGWSVLSIDHPPFGFSGEAQPEGLSMDPQGKDAPSRARLLWHAINQITGRNDSRVVLLGHSLGRRIVSHMTLDQPGRVEKLILLAPAVYGKSAIPSLGKYWPFNCIVRNHANLVMENKAIVRFIMKKAYGRPMTHEEFIGNFAPFLRPGVIDACGEWAVVSVDSGEPAMEEIHTKSLILWARHDGIVRNRGHKLKKQMPRAEYVEIPGKSHCIMDTDGELVSSLVIDFLTGE